MSKVQWIKLKIDMFEDEKIRLIEKLPDGDTLIVIWLKLLTQAGKTNANGFIMLTEHVPLSVEMLSTLFDRPLQTLRYALQTFHKFGMIEMNENDVIEIANWSKHQNIDALDKVREQNAIRQKRYRDKQKALSAPKKESNVTDHVTSRTQNKNKNKNLKEIYKENVTQDVTPTDKIQFAEFVFLKQSEYDNLVKEYGESVIQDFIERLDEWQTNQKPTKRKVDHNKTIRNWLKKDGVKPLPVVKYVKPFSIGDIE